ncbi:20088_t:CDS:2, partial [Funneliformis geosporum]
RDNSKCYTGYLKKPSSYNCSPSIHKRCSPTRYTNSGYSLIRYNRDRSPTRYSSDHSSTRNNRDNVVSNLDIETLSRTISALTEEVRSIKNSQATGNLQGELQEEETSSQASVPQAEYRQKIYHLHQNWKSDTFKEMELKWILQNLHRHCKENWIVSLDPNKDKAEKKRKGINSRRKDKKEQQQKGIVHMFNINDSLLAELQSSSLSLDDFKEDC